MNLFFFLSVKKRWQVSLLLSLSTFWWPAVRIVSKMQDFKETTFSRSRQFSTFLFHNFSAEFNPENLSKAHFFSWILHDHLILCFHVTCHSFSCYFFAILFFLRPPLNDGGISSKTEYLVFFCSFSRATTQAI